MGLIEKKYKQTELGIIPNDWQIREFQDVMTGFFSGATPYRGRPEYYKGVIKWITSGELNYNIITDTIEKITEQAVKNTNLKILPKGTFLFAITGLEAEGTRGSCGVTGVEATTNQSCMALFPKETLDSNYLYHFYVWQGKMLAFKYCQGTKQQSYTAKIARTLPIIIPPTKSEQTAIATALSDIDVLIENLEKHIAKKQRIKQGVLQELLTGKKRLIGFDRKWEKVKLGDLGKTYGGLSGKTKSDFQNGNSPYIPFLNILNNPIIDPTYLDYVNIRLEESQNKAQKGDLFFNGSSETPEEVGMCSILMDDIPTLYLNSFCFGFRLFNQENSNGLFLTYYFRSLEGRKLIFSLAQGATRYNLSKTNFLKTELRIPDPGEQSAIASIIKDVDDEIGILNKKFNKLHMIKRGMMQSLLTGKIRLI